MKNLQKFGKVLSTAAQKNVNGGRRPVNCIAPGSLQDCTFNPRSCPAGEGCFIEDTFSPSAHCRCL